MRTRIRHTSLSVLMLCICSACASGGGRADTRFEQNVRFVQVTNERNGDFVFYLLGDSVGEQPGRGRFRIPLAETGTLPSYEVAWSPPR